MTTTTTQRFQVAIIGAGFGGLGMAYYLKQAGIDDFVLLEKASDVGGTWRENTYPGSGCDVPSHMYSYSFERRYPWAWRYAKQPEIYAYARHVADKYDIRRHARFGVEVSEARYDDAQQCWRLKMADGSQLEATTLVSAVGQLHRPAYPDIPGRERYQGAAFHSSHWDHSFDFRGKTVGVIGSGASAVQFVPEIAREVKTLKLFQRSPGWVAPKVEKRFSRIERWLIDNVPGLESIDRFRIYLILEALAYAYNGHAWAEKIVEKIARLMLRIQVKDPSLRARLTPNFPVGCKRILLSADWLRTLAKPHVEVVDQRITGITEAGVTTADGTHHAVDAIVYGTGFAATRFLAPMHVYGRDGRDLHAGWQKGAEAYLGMAVAGFPNFFMLYGPNTNVGSGSIIFMLERQQRYIVSLLKSRAAKGWGAIEVNAEAQAEYAAEMQSRSENTTYSGNCQSWYKTADGRNTNNWVGSMTEFHRRTRQPILAHFNDGRGVGERGGVARAA